MKILNSIFDYQSFMPHGYCFLWVPEVLWAQIISEVTIGSAYIIISGTLAYLVFRRRNIPFSWILALFAIFILLCGLTHFIGLITIWYPVYVLDSIVKVLTAAASIATALVLFPLLPRIIEVFGELLKDENKHD